MNCESVTSLLILGHLNGEHAHLCKDYSYTNWHIHRAAYEEEPYLSVPNIILNDMQIGKLLHWDYVLSAVNDNGILEVCFCACMSWWDSYSLHVYITAKNECIM